MFYGRAIVAKTNRFNVVTILFAPDIQCFSRLSSLGKEQTFKGLAKPRRKKSAGVTVLRGTPTSMQAWDPWVELSTRGF